MSMSKQSMPLHTWNDFFWVLSWVAFALSADAVAPIVSQVWSLALFLFVLSSLHSHQLMKLVGMFKIKSVSDHACYCRGWWWCCLACTLPRGLRGSLGSRRHTRKTSRSSPARTCRYRTCTYRDKNTAQRSRCSPKKERKNILSTEKNWYQLFCLVKKVEWRG